MNSINNGIKPISKTGNSEKKSNGRIAFNIGENINPNIDNSAVATTNNHSDGDISVSDDKSKRTFREKQFRSRYIDDNGKWTQNAADEGYIGFNEYIGDIKNTDDKFISYNNKMMNITDYDLTDNSDKNNINGKNKECYKENNDYDMLSKEDINHNRSASDSEKETSFLINPISAEMSQQNFTPKGIWNKALQTIKDGIVKTVKAGKEYFDEQQIELQRNTWKTGAEHYLRRYKKCLTSAWMLEHSLQDNPTDIERGNDSRIAYLINNSSEYRDAIDKAISQSDGKTLNTYIDDLAFEKDEDLKFSVHSMDIRVNGWKMENGRWFIHSLATDVYDFTVISSITSDGELSQNFGIGTISNDFAVLSQKLGAISPYKVTVDFYTVR